MMNNVYHTTVYKNEDIQIDYCPCLEKPFLIIIKDKHGKEQYQFVSINYTDMNDIISKMSKYLKSIES